MKHYWVTCIAPTEQTGQWTFFHLIFGDTWQWLMARRAQLAPLLPPELADGVSWTPLWRKLAIGATTSLYMKAMALACVPASITPIQTTSISIWTHSNSHEGCTFLLSTHVLYSRWSALCSWQSNAEQERCFSHRKVWRWSQIPGEERASREKSHWYLVGCQSSDSSQTAEPLVLKYHSLI